MEGQLSDAIAACDSCVLLTVNVVLSLLVISADIGVCTDKDRTVEVFRFPMPAQSLIFDSLFIGAV